MSTRLINVTGGPVSLPLPYRGILGPGRGCILSDAPLTVIANLGGADQVIPSFRVEPTTEPGQAAFDPDPSLPTNATVATADGTATTIATVAVPLGKTILIEVAATGMRDDTAAGGAYVARASFKNDGGVVTQIGSSSDDYVGEDDSSWTGPDFAISGTDVLVQVIGVAATAIDWSVDYTVHSS